MSYKSYYISLMPGGRPRGAAQFGSASEKKHYEEIVSKCRNFRGFKLLNSLGVVYAELTEEEAVRIAKYPEVREVELVKLRKPAVITQPSAGWALAAICDRQTEDKYTYAMQGEKVSIYILDDGVGAGVQPYFLGGFERIFNLHPELDGCKHGSLVASSAAHKTFGVAKRARIIDVKCGDENDLIEPAQGFDAIIAHHTEGKPAVCNMSFGAYDDPSSVESDAIDAMKADGVICIAAAGNDATDNVSYPAGYCISVGASNDLGEVSSFSNYGSTIDLFAPGEFTEAMDRFGDNTLFSGTSAASPFTAGVAAVLMSYGFMTYTTDTMCDKLKALAKIDGVTHTRGPATTRLLLQSSQAVIWEGTKGAADTAFTEKLANLNFRKRYRFEFSNIEDTGAETAIASSTFETTQHAIGSCFINLGGDFTSPLASLNFTSIQVNAGDNPISDPSKPILPVSSPGSGAVIPIYATVGTSPGQAQLQKEELISMSISLNEGGGTASFSSTQPTIYNIKDPIYLQGLGCLVARIKPILGPAKEYSVECIVSADIASEYISISHPYAEDGKFISVHALLKEVADKAGVDIRIAVPDVKLLEFVEAGKYSTLLNNLAEKVFAVTIQQNGLWYVVSGRDPIGEFKIENVATSSYSRSELGDVTNTVLDFLIQYIEALKEKHAIEKDLEDLKKELEKLEKIKTEEEAAGKETENRTITSQFLGTADFKFGRANNSGWQSLPDKYLTEGGSWEYWTPMEGKNNNPTKPARQYYRVEAVRNSSGLPTGEMRGLYNIQGLTVLVPIQEPSNFGGLYYIRGRSLNLLGAVTTDIWAPPSVRTNQFLNTTTHQFETETFFEFRPKSGLVDNPEDEDKVYMLDIEIRYMPSITVPWKFAGTILYDFWPLKNGTSYIGRINRDGDVVDPSGVSVTTVDDLTEIPGNPTNEHCVVNQAGELCALGSASGYFRALNSTPAGTYSPVTWELRSNGVDKGSLLGYVAGELPNNHTWAGLGDTEEWPTNPAIYFSSSMPGGHGIDYSGYDPDHPELWDPTVDPADEAEVTKIAELKITILEKENELITLTINIDNIAAELISYGAATLEPLAKAVATAEIALSDEIDRQQKLNVTNTGLIVGKREAVGLANDSLYSALSSLNLTSLEVTCSFIYNNELPLPQNDITLQGPYFYEDFLTLTNASLQLGSKTVSITAVRRIA